jgi:site-specific recombinase XerD
VQLQSLPAIQGTEGEKLDKVLTSHVARHTFATYLINRDIPVESVSKALGHASIRQTQHYARLPGKKVRNRRECKRNREEGSQH